MRTLRTITSVCLPILLLAACHGKKEEPQPDNNAVVHIDAGIEGLSNRSQVNETTGIGSFESGKDIWGLYAYVGNDAKLVNEAYTYGKTILYWNDLSAEAEVAFYAHFPKQRIISPESYNFDAAGAGNGNRQNADLLFASAKGRKEANSSNNPLNLRFRHLMHQLVVEIDYSEAEGIPLTIELLNMKSTVPVDLLLGYVDLESASGNTEYEVFTLDSSSRAIFYVAPQNVVAGTGWMKITFDNGDEYVYNVPQSLNDGTPLNALNSGMRLALTLVLKKTETGSKEVELASSEISGWGDQGAVDSDVDSQLSGWQTINGDELNLGNNINK